MEALEQTVFGFIDSLEPLRRGKMITALAAPEAMKDA